MPQGAPGRGRRRGEVLLELPAVLGVFIHRVWQAMRAAQTLSLPVHLAPATCTATKGSVLAPPPQQDRDERDQQQQQPPDEQQVGWLK